MKIRLNGEDRETEAATIIQLLRELDIVPERVAVEANLTVVRKADYETYRLQNGDVIEVVYFVGGGRYGR